MKKISLFLLFAIILLFAGKSIGQVAEPCATTKMYNIYKKQHPEVAAYEKQLAEETVQYYKTHGNNMDLSKFARTSADTQYYDIPVVIHVMHNYGAELTYLTDNFIYHTIALMNEVYALQNDTTSVIKPFKKYVGKTTIRFHLATKDPFGNPTKGILHHATYLTYGGDDQVKMDLWPPSNYYNIWFENVIGAASEPGSVILAYANFPASAATYPYNDGVISRYNSDSYLPFTIEHETGHYFNLLHPWNNNGDGDGAIDMGCGDDDVDDTPPTPGHFSVCPLYDTACAENYYKIYSDINGNDSLVDYPDTANVQNIMDYSSCTNMFTKGQVARMDATLNSNIGFRDSLWSPTNLYNTGAFNPMPDLPPVTDFAVTSGTTLTYFTCPGINLKFTNESWGDTVIGVTWSFSNGASTPTKTATETPTSANNVTSSVTNSFQTPGWLSFTLAATGNNSGTTTTTYPRSVFIADSTGTPVANYFMEFNNADTAKWPMFNYYNNQFKWKMANVGYYDNNCIEYCGFDTTLNPLEGLYPPTGSPGGDYDDFFSTPMDFTGISSGNFYLNFYYSGASRSSTSTDINDKLEIDYSIDHAASWQLLDTMVKGNLDNMGASYLPYTPTSMVNWAPKSVTLPAAAKTNYTLFRFRYYPNNGGSIGIYGSNGFYPLSSGNNFYMDRISFSSIPTVVNDTKLGSLDVAVVPNPTNGDAYVIVKDADNATAKVIVMDITGKVVYTTTQQLAGNTANILIPHASIQVQGMYMVQTITGNQSRTEKLVVY